MKRPAALFSAALLLAACSQVPSTGTRPGADLRAQATGSWVSGTYTNAYGSRFYRL